MVTASAYAPTPTARESLSRRVEGLAVQVRDVSHRFELNGAQLPVLDHIDFSVKPGEFVALLGPSGCGKSTLLRLIAGLEPPSEGKIGANGVRITGPDPSRLLVFQNPTLYPWRTVRGNIAFGLEARGIRKENEYRVDAALQLTGLADFSETLPHQLSGGMAQRVALARVLVNDPELLLLDEPLGKLDALTRMTMQTELLRIWQDAHFTTLLVTHDVEEALLLAQRVVVFTDRPARIANLLDVDLPYPRHRDDPRFIALRREILASLGHEYEL